MDREEYERLIARLRGTVENTTSAYQDAKTPFELAKDLEIHHPDGGYATRQSLRKENQTLMEYKAALFRFNRLILDGKIPDESD